MPIDAEQLALLITNHAACLRLWIRSRCAAPEDVVQDAFCRLAVEHPQPTHPVAWLYRVSRNLAEKQRLSDARRQRREQARARPLAECRHPVDSAVIEEIQLAVEQLPGELREVLVARVWGQLSLAEIGQLSGVSSATVSRRYEAALHELKLKLQPEPASWKGTLK